MNILGPLDARMGTEEPIGEGTRQRDRHIKLVQSTERDLSLIINTIPALVWSARPDGSAEFFNKYYLDYVGLSAEQVQGWGWTVAVHPEDLKDLAQAWQSIIDSGKPGEAEARLRRFDGEYRWFLLRANPLRNESGNIVKWYGINTDICDRRHAEEDLRNSEERHRLFVEAANVAVINIDENGIILLANPATRGIFGYDPVEILGKPLTILMPEMMRKVHETGFKRYLTTGVRHLNWQSVELTAMRKGGQQLPVEVSFGEMTSNGHKVFTGFIRDISDKKKAEETLRASEHNLRLIVDSIPGLVCIMTGAGEFDLANRQFLDYTGKTLDEMKNWPAIVHPDDLPIVVSRLKGSFETGCPFDTEVRVRRADSKYRWFHCCGLPLRDETGRVIRWYKLLTDIEDRKHAEEALRARERDLSLIIETMPGLVWCADPEGELTYVNQRILEYMGSTPGALAQLGWADFLHSDDREPTVRAWSRAVATGQPFEAQCRLRGSDGIYRWFHVLGQAARDDQNRVTRWYGLLIDINERKNMEEALRSSHTRLSRATRNATIGEFAAATAHEINQPLSAVVANGHACLRWLATNPPGLVKAQEAAERIVRDGMEAGEVVRRIRSLFRRAPLENIELDVNEVIDEVLRLLSNEIAKKRIVVETDLDRDLVPITGDRVQLQQLVFNLLLNGIEAMDSVGDRRRKLSIRTRLQGPETVFVEIRDWGVGLEDSEKVFEAFFTTKENGMGMGLAICRSIVDAHHGRLWAAPTEGNGSTFSFTLPVRPDLCS